MAKYCPACGSFFLYDDSQTVCPDCGRRLEVYRPYASPNVETPPPAEERRETRGSTPHFEQAQQQWTYAAPPSGGQNRQAGGAAPSNPAFRIQEGGRCIFRGAVFHVDTVVREYGFLRKVFYSVFSGEPFQLGRTSYLTNIRLEEHTDAGFPEQSETVIYYGDIESQLATGDDVQIQCVRHRGRYMAERIYSFDHNRSLSPESIRVSAWLVRALFLFVVLALFAFTTEVIYFFASGAFLALLSQLMLPLILIGALWFWLRSRRWRR